MTEPSLFKRCHPNKGPGRFTRKTGVSVMLRDEKYPYRFFKPYECDTNLSITIRSDYAFYRCCDWDKDVLSLYPNNGRYFLVRDMDEIDARLAIERGEAACVDYMYSGIQMYSGTQCNTSICCKRHNKRLWFKLHRQRKILVQMILNRLLPEPSLSRRIEEYSR